MKLRIAIGFLIVLSVNVTCVQEGFSQSVGDRIVITANFDTKIKTTRVGKVYGGAIHTVTAVQGKWCMLEGVRGWAPLQYTMNLDSAKKVYAARAAANQRDYDALAVLGMIHFEQGQNKQALDYLTKSLRQNNRIASVWNNRAIVFSDEGQYDRAKSDLETALKLKPNYAGALANRGLIHVAIGRLDEAIADFGKAIQQEPGNPTHYKNRGSAHHAQGNLNKALTDYRQAIKIDRHYFKAFVGCANVYLAIEDFRAAKDNAEEAVRLAPKSSLALNNLGWIQYRLDQHEDAIKTLTAAIKVDGRMSIAYSNRGVVRMAQEKYDAAMDDFDLALRLSPESAVAYNNRAGAWVARKKYVKALKDFEKAIELSPEMSDATNALAWFLATCPDGKFRDPVRSLQLIKKLIKQSEEVNAEFLDTYAAALAESGDFKKAVAEQKKAVADASPKNRQAYIRRLKSYEEEKPFRSEFGRRN